MRAVTRVLAPVLALALGSGAALADNNSGFPMTLFIKEANRETLSISPPTVDIALYRPFVPGEPPFESRSFEFQGKARQGGRSSPEVLEYWQNIGGAELINMAGRLVIDSDSHTVRDLTTLNVQLNPEELGSTQKKTLTVWPRGSIAESYRREATSILQRPNPSADAMESAALAISLAIELDPRIDNYLQAVKITRRALREDVPYSSMLTSNSDLQALQDFRELSFEQRWLVQLELLESLSNARDPDRQVGTGETLSELTLILADDMIASLATADTDLQALPATRVFHIRSLMHKRAEDCFAQIEGSGEALDYADRLAMNWASQKTFLENLSECLVMMSRFGDGRSEEQVLEDVRGSVLLSTAWKRFATHGDDVAERLTFDTSSKGQRLKDLWDFAKKVRDE